MGHNDTSEASHNQKKIKQNHHRCCCLHHHDHSEKEIMSSEKHNGGGTGDGASDGHRDNGTTNHELFSPDDDDDDLMVEKLQGVKVEAAGSPAASVPSSSVTPMAKKLLATLPATMEQDGGGASLEEEKRRLQQGMSHQHEGLDKKEKEGSMPSLQQRQTSGDDTMPLPITSLEQQAAIGARSTRPGAYSIYPRGNHHTRLSREEQIMDIADEETAQEDMESGTHPTTTAVGHLAPNDDPDFQAALQQRLESRMIQATDVVNVHGVDTTTSKKKEIHRNGGNYIKMALSLFALGFICLVVVAIVCLPRNREKSDSNVIVPVTPDQDSSTIVDNHTIMDIIRHQLLPVSGEEALLDPTSSQYLTLHWVANDDPLVKSYFDENNISSSEVIDDGNALPPWIVERYIVALIYFATDGPNWVVDLGFLSNKTVCDWPPLNEGQRDDTKPGVSCDAGTGLVNSIQLISIGLNGTLPAYELSFLTSLQTLYIDINPDLHGTIPDEFGLTLTNLKLLAIASAQMTGTIPETLSNLRKLEIMQFGSNRLTGTIPPNLLYELSNLEYISVAWNLLTGPLPDASSGAIRDLSNRYEESPLRTLWFTGNSFTGTIPSSYYELLELNEFLVADNMLEGPIATEMGQLTNLFALFLESNHFEGTLPTELGLLTDLYILVANSNRFTGTIPSELGRLNGAEDMYLQHNMLTGSIPSELGDLSELIILDISSNPITGIIPASFDDPSALVHFYVKNTSLAVNAFDSYCGIAPDGVESNATVETKAIFATTEADCAPVGEDGAPEANCSCCTTCCNDEGMCIRDRYKECEITNNKYTEKTGFRYDERRNTTCTCNEDGTEQFCYDDPTTTCLSCNSDGSICALNKRYGLTDSGWQTTFEYVKGRPINETVTFQWNYEDDCIVTVNGQLCQSCFEASCDDGFSAFNVFCDNIEGVGNLDVCDDNYDDGALTVLALLDEVLLGGDVICPVRIQM